MFIVKGMHVLTLWPLACLGCGSGSQSIIYEQTHACVGQALLKDMMGINIPRLFLLTKIGIPRLISM